jgi:hypothetical protein
MNSKKSFELGMYNIMYDSVDWQIADQPFDGDDYNNLHSRVMKKAIEIMFLQTQNK